MRLAAELRPQGRQMGEVVLDRLVELTNDVKPEAVEALFDVLGRGMDGLARRVVPYSGYPPFLRGVRGRYWV